LQRGRKAALFVYRGRLFGLSHFLSTNRYPLRRKLASSMTTVTATQAARDLIGKLISEHGPLSLHVSGSYGVTVICLKAHELSIGARDELIGTIEDAPMFLMTSEIEYWRGSALILDVAHGIGPGFSLEGPLCVHFTLRKRANPAKRTWDADAILAAGAPPSYNTGDTDT
jgi:hypothetical protein